LTLELEPNDQTLLHQKPTMTHPYAAQTNPHDIKRDNTLSKHSFCLGLSLVKVQIV